MSDELLDLPPPPRAVRCTEAMSRPDAAVEPPSPWIESAVWDLGWIQCGFWLAALHVLLLPRPTGFAAWYAFAFLAFWMSHRAGTIFISYGLKDYRALAAAQRTRFLDLPALWFAFAFALLFALGLIPVLRGYRGGQTLELDWLLKSWWSNADRGLVFKLSAALAYGLSYAHNAWDAAVFRFKDPAVRRVSLPLILGTEPEPARVSALRA